MEVNTQFSDTDRTRLWSRIVTGNVIVCWPWTGAVDIGGYGVFWVNGRSEKAHRVAWVMTNGQLPTEGYLLHSCFNHLCCNPAHLKPGKKEDIGRHRFSNPDFVPPLRQPRRTEADLNVEDIALFWAKAPTGSEAECHVWTDYCSTAGYGRLKLKPYGYIPAHRAAWIIHNGPIPDGLCVCHKCDNPPCVNPAHLFLDTPEGNNADRDAKGRTARGDRSGFRRHPERVPRGETHHKRAKGVKITYDQADYIRSMKGIKTCFLLADELDISFQMVSNIWRGKAWPERSTQL